MATDLAAMTEAEILPRIQAVYRRVFQAPDLHVTRATAAADVARWDSLSHVEMIAAVEAEFQLKFKLKDLLKWKNTGDLVDTIVRMQNPA